MMKTALFTLLALSAYSVDAATKVAVVELGNGGTVRRTTSKNPDSSVQGVTSFWSALHSHGRNLQQAGMVVVPDLFNKADSGIVFGIQGSGVDLDSLPFISSLFEDDSDRSVGHMEIAGSHCNTLMKGLKGVEDVEPDMVVAASKKHAAASGISGFKTLVTSENAAGVEAEFQAMMESLERAATAAGNTVVLHFIVEEDENSASHRRRLTSRRLEDEADQDEGDNNNNQNQNGDGDGDYPGYYGYGYYNTYGEWVTPYKTMFQIQYFNVVLWTALGLTITVFFTIYLMVNMPLEPDTLLFGESAKMVGDD